MLKAEVRKVVQRPPKVTLGEDGKEVLAHDGWDVTVLVGSHFGHGKGRPVKIHTMDKPPDLKSYVQIVKDGTWKFKTPKERKAEPL